SRAFLEPVVLRSLADAGRLLHALCIAGPRHPLGGTGPFGAITLWGAARRRPVGLEPARRRGRREATYSMPVREPRIPWLGRAGRALPRRRGARTPRRASRRDSIQLRSASAHPKHGGLCTWTRAPSRSVQRSTEKYPATTSPSTPRGPP